MKDIEELCKKIIKRSKDKEAKWYYGVEYSCERKDPEFKAYVGFSKEGVQPLMFTAATKASIKKQLQDFLNRKTHSIDVTIAYYEGQIKVHNQVTRFFEKHVEELKSGATSEAFPSESPTE